MHWNSLEVSWMLMGSLVSYNMRKLHWSLIISLRLELWLAQILLDVGMSKASSLMRGWWVLSR